MIFMESLLYWSPWVPVLGLFLAGERRATAVEIYSPAIEGAGARSTHAIIEKVGVAVKVDKPHAVRAPSWLRLCLRNAPASRDLLLQREGLFLLRLLRHIVFKAHYAAFHTGPAPAGKLDAPHRIAGEHDHRAKALAVGEANDELGNIADHIDALNPRALQRADAGGDLGPAVRASI